MKQILYFILLFTLVTNGQSKDAIQSIKLHQLEQNIFFQTKGKSPLKEIDRKYFKELDFFDINLSFRVEAILKKTPSTSFFQMKTTTDRLSDERIYGVLSFVLKGKEYHLNVYQGKQLMTQKGYEDYLFLPFLDDTNSETTYGGGRYLDLRIPNGNKIIVDFNKAYNPYCYYNSRYSCPIVPSENYIPLKITAGIKK
ncbi:DUF1684 domain-containing protein [Flavobacteriaceae bacterium]|jgi:uncharacterized protein|nr:DUF1684 domain-containing protein [Flavobacteriaceae bacterium]